MEEQPEGGREGHQLSRGHCAKLLCPSPATLPSEAYFEGSGARFTLSPFPPNLLTKQDIHRTEYGL